MNSFALRSATSVAVAPKCTRNVSARAASEGQINASVDKANPKVVTAVSVKDIEKQAVYCRCWKSGTFPLCDGAHMKHNEATGDNVGPLIVKKE